MESSHSMASGFYGAGKLESRCRLTGRAVWQENDLGNRAAEREISSTRQSDEKKDETQMKLTGIVWTGAGGRMGQRLRLKLKLKLGLCLIGMALGVVANAQAVSTTTLQGTVYLANGQPGAGTLVISWPAFTTAAGQAVVADSMTVTIPPDGFVSVNLAPNLGATPAGEYYTAVYYMSDGTVSTQYWVIPAAAQATLSQVQAQVMPAAQAIQTVSKAYVDEAITEMTQSLLTASGGTLSGPLYLNADPTQPLQAATKHYVDTQVATALPLTGGTVSGTFSALEIGGAYQVDQFPGADFGAKIQACVSLLNASYGGTCDARNFAGSLSMASNLTISTPNTAILLPCATIATANQILVTAGTRNVSLRGCALRGGTQASGSQGGTVFAYSGAGAMVAGGRSNICRGYTGLSYGQRSDQYHRSNQRNGARTSGLPDAGDGSREPVLPGQRKPDGHDAGWNRELHGRDIFGRSV